MGYAVIWEISRDRSIDASFGAIAFSVYLVLSAILITTVVSRLYNQHQLRLFRIDIANLILLTVLFALPFALANTMWVIYEPDHGGQVVTYKTTVLLILSGVAIFLLLPVFFVAEALLTWWSQIFGPGNR